MKRLSIIMATAILLVSCLCMTADAQGTVKFSANAPTEVGLGTTFTVSVDFSENSGFNTLGVKLTYPEGFTYVADSAAASNLIKEKFYLDFAGYQGETFVFNHDEDARTITFVGASLYDIEQAAGSLFSAKFTAPDAEAAGKQFKVEKLDEVYDATGEKVTVTTTDDNMNVVEITYILGDVNGDEFVDLFDAIDVLQYEAGMVEFTELQCTIGDVNKDGFVDLFDAIDILQYEAGMIEDFE